MFFYKRSFIKLLSVLVCVAGAALSANAADWDALAEESEAWYRSDAGRHVVQSILAHQREHGGWDKGYDPTEPIDQAATDAARPQPGTIDNDATVGELRVLARFHSLTGDPAAAEAFQAGLRYLLDAQYDHGGWPQYFPLRGGYHDAITYNDDAMFRAVELMRDVAQGHEPFGFVDSSVREHAADAYKRGVQAVLDTQVVVNGQRTVWCAQHDARTLEPTDARAYELKSLSGAESVKLVRLLMATDDPSPEVIQAVQSAVSWFHDNAIHGVDYQRIVQPDGTKDRRLIETDNPDHRWWPRFAEIGTNRPIFCGRDGIVRYDLGEVELERRLGYSWYSRRAVKLLDEEYPAWQQRWAPERDVLTASE